MSASVYVNDDPSTLRTQISDIQRCIAEFEKWKILSIGTVFAAGFGLTSAGDQVHHRHLVFFAIPFLTLCVDFYIYDWHMKLCVIQGFLCRQENQFEKYAQEKLSPGGLDWFFAHAATLLSSIAANLGLLLLIFVSQVFQEPTRMTLLVLASLGVSAAVLSFVVVWHLAKQLLLKARSPVLDSPFIYVAAIAPIVVALLLLFRVIPDTVAFAP